LDQLRKQVGDAPEAWYEALTGHPWPGDASHGAVRPEARQ
jgi:hypothetical protein